MPILHIQYALNNTDSNGQPFAVPPQAALASAGPRVQVTVTVAESIAQQLVIQGDAVPSPVAGWALLDTGASNTCIDEDVAQQLGLPAVDVITMASASHASTLSNVYPIQVEVIGFQIRLNVERTIGAALASQGLLLLIGRDVLQACTFIYNGFTGEITLAI